MKFIEQDILKIERGIICHQVNCQRVMGGGIALAIRNQWPEVYESYKQVDMFLGACHMVQIVPRLWVANLAGQDNFGSGLQTNYYALAIALYQAVEEAGFIDIPLYIPYGMGCGLAGGDWNEVLKIIEIAAPDAIICRLPEISLDTSR